MTVDIINKNNAHVTAANNESVLIISKQLCSQFEGNKLIFYVSPVYIC